MDPTSILLFMTPSNRNMRFSCPAVSNTAHELLTNSHSRGQCATCMAPWSMHTCRPVSVPFTARIHAGSLGDKGGFVWHDICHHGFFQHHPTKPVNPCACWLSRPRYNVTLTTHKRVRENGVNIGWGLIQRYLSASVSFVMNPKLILSLLLLRQHARTS